jgi:hypothetical protein
VKKFINLKVLIFGQHPRDFCAFLADFQALLGVGLEENTENQQSIN